MVNITPGAPPTPARVEVAGVSKSFGPTPVLLDVSLDAGAGSMLALLGPSGCGKTTLLRIIAGLEAPDTGEVRVAGETLTGPGGQVPPEKRRVGMVFQDWALFPHLTVARNVGFGLPRAERSGHRVDQALEMVGLGGMGDRMPGTLSGGQQQRVALARAIAPEPTVLLLDEPFSNLDTTLRVQVRSEVHQLLVELGITTIFVTHDQDEAFVLGSEVAVMHRGRIVQQGSPTALYTQPVDAWVAGFVGEANLLEARAEGGTAVTEVGEVALASERRGECRVLLRPEDLELGAPAGDGGASGDRSSGDAAVELVEYYGHDTLYVLRMPGGGSLRVRAGSAPRFARGDLVRARYTGGPTVAFPSGEQGRAAFAATAEAGDREATPKNTGSMRSPLDASPVAAPPASG